MRDKDKSKAQLIRELVEVRRRIAQLETLAAESQIIPSAHHIEPFYP